MGWQAGKSGHWHGYGPWVGSGPEYAREGLRRPGTEFHSQQTRVFLDSKLPPLMTGHSLMRVNQTARERTWTDVKDVVAWLSACYAENPPFRLENGGSSYGPLERKVSYVIDALPRGVDVVWAYWTKGGSLASYSVVCCPNHFLPEIPCPLPPGETD